ncbi:glycoside hydrolase family 19 protein [Aquimarina aquimarini]|uniref:glycoside hydrolase family 19 protein n=1 Tax=Aquimarina aquimarini TaxID=1191734 RepID=UPI000D553E2F|nr:hypothetical protein [Aquimarina aquimarini]
MKFVYPVKKQNYDENYFSFQYGSFPISTFNVWHGGVHLEVIEGELQPIADGRIIAYNFPEQYKEPCVDGTTVQYSDGFLLLQHDYQSQNNQKIRYYSLYHHIASKKHINDTDHLSPPSFLAEQKTIVTAKNYPMGVRGRSATIEEGKTRGREIAVIPQHYIVTRNDDTKLAEWAVNYNKGKSEESKKYYSYTFTDPITNTFYEDIHIYSRCLEKIEEGKYKVKSYNKETNSVTRKGNRNVSTPLVNPDIEAGILLYEKKGAQSKCIGLIPKDTEVKVVEGQKDNQAWIQLEGYEGYVNKNEIKQQNQFKEDVKFDTVVASDIPVKAGETIGYVGKFGFGQKPTHDTTHFEIFTDQDITDFLIDKKEDGKDLKKHYKIAAGATLEPNMATAMTVKAKTPITITKTKGDYRKVKVIAVERSLLRYYSVQNTKETTHVTYNGSTYEINKGKLAEVNIIFNQNFTMATKFKKVSGKKGYPNGKSDATRLLRYTPDHHGKEFWIHKNRIINACDVSENGQLRTDINEVYKEEPIITDGNPITVEKDTSTVKNLKKHTDSNGDLWYYIQCKYMIEYKTVTKKGWVKECDTHLSILNPFNWRDFGFKPLEAGSDYVFDIEGYNDKEDTCDFIQEIWGNLDTTEDQVLDSLEIKRAYRNPKTRDQITKLICKHKSEWSYDPATIKQEAEQYYQIGINQEKRADKKQQLINKKNILLDALQERVNNLMWWDKVQSAKYDPPPPPLDPEAKKKPENKRSFGTDTIDQSLFEPLSIPKNTGKTNDYSLPSIPEMNVDLVAHSNTETTVPEVETKEEQKAPERTLPSTDTVWHFHPVAFVKQMRMMYGGGDCLQCEAEFTYEQIKRIFPNAAKNETLAKELIDELNLVREKYKINTCQKKAHLIAQFGSETGFNTLTENLKDYSIDGLKKFSYFKRNPNEAKLYVGNTKEIAKRVYGLRNVDKESDIITCVGLSKKERKTKKCNDLGNESMADGYNYIGRGLIQLTGKYNYENINREFKKAFPNQGDLIDNPELLEKPKYAVMSAMSYWINNKLGNIANSGGIEKVDEITKIINRHTSSKSKRREAYEMAKVAFKLFECSLLRTEENTEEKCTSCGKKHVDLTLNIPFKSQGSGNTNCAKTCKLIVENMGLGIKSEGAAGGEYKREGINKKLYVAFFQLAHENSSRNGFIWDKLEVKQGMDYLNSSLDKGYPVTVGVNHTFKGRKHGIINEDTTDHYVLIIGRYCENGKTYYPYYDVGTQWGNLKSNYKFELQSDNSLVNEKAYGTVSGIADNRKFTVTQIRRNTKNGKVI